MDRNSIIILLFFLLNMQNVCAQDRPAWTELLPDLPDSPGQYQGLGIAESTGDQSADWETAINRARSDLAGQVHVHIFSETTSRVTELEIGDDVDIEDYFNQEIQAISEITLQDVPVQRWFDRVNEVYYAYIVIPATYMQDLRSELLGNAQYVSQFYGDTADEFIQAGNIYAGILMYLEGMDELLRIKENVQRTGGQSRVSYDIDDIISRVEANLCKVVDKVEISSRVTFDHQLDATRPYPGLIEGRVIFHQEDKGEMLATSQFPILLRTEDEFDANFRLEISDELFRVNLIEVLSASARNDLMIYLNLPNYNSISERPPALNACLQRFKRTETILVKGKRDTRIYTHVEVIENGEITENNHVTENIRSSLSQLGFEALAGNAEICQNPNSVDGYLVCGSVRLDDRSNPRPNFYFASAEGTFEILNRSDQSVVRILQPGQIRDGGSSFSQARNRTIQTISQAITGEISELFEQRYRILRH